MGLENLKIKNNETLDTIVDEIGELENEIKTKKANGESAADIIQSLNKEQLTNYIENSLKEGDYRLTYQEMKTKPFFPFIVQATIDLLSNQLGDKKINIDGNEDKENGYTLDEWIEKCGGIDNTYGNGTKKVVKIIQKYYKGMEEDGFAGPQFFAKMCSIFKGENYVRDFKVKGYDDKPYKYGFENKDLKNDNNTEAKEIDGYKINLNDGITIGEYKDGMGYELNIPGVEGEFYAYKGKKNGKDTVLFGNPVKDSGIKKYITVERTEGGITVKLQQQENHAKNDVNPAIPKDWDKNIEFGMHCTEDTSEFINNNNDKLSFTESNKQDYLKILDSILGDPKKSPTFNSFIKLDKKFWLNYRLTYEDLKNFDKNAGKNTGCGFDATRKGDVFHETWSANDDYLMYRDGKIIRHNGLLGRGNSFEVDGTDVICDEQFDSVECFCKYIAGVPIEQTRKNVRNLAKEDREITYRSEKIRPEVINKTATLQRVGFGDTSKRGLQKRKTFISLLELPDNFWKSYKLSEKDINNFAKGMQNNIFDSGNSTVFHTERVGEEGINKNVPMFEVDGSSSGNHRSDRKFTSVSYFFYALDQRLETGKRPK